MTNTKADNYNRIKKIIDNMPVGEAFLVKKIQDETGMHYGSIRDMLQVMCDQGFISMHEDSKMYFKSSNIRKEVKKELFEELKDLDFWWMSPAVHCSLECDAEKPSHLMIEESGKRFCLDCWIKRKLR